MLDRRPSHVAKRVLVPFTAGVIALGACSSTSSPTAPGDAGVLLDANAATDGASAGDASGGSSEIRGQRYCEILLVTVSGSGAHVDVYTTFGLNDCPAAAWSAVDATKVATDAGVNKVLLNGPRYWTLDRFLTASFIDPTPRTLGGLEMRHGGSIDVPLSALSSLGSAPYTAKTIQRSTTVELDTGKTVYELVGPDGKIYDMQSYSVQKTAQTEPDLATLGARLTLPTGWSYRTRTLTAPLQITAVGGLATVVQDDFDDTYQLSQQ
jgi:hypothetical protein